MLRSLPCSATGSVAPPALVTGLETYRDDNRSWLDNYCLYSALKRSYRGAPWHEWPEAVAQRQPEALQRWAGDGKAGKTIALCHFASQTNNDAQSLKKLKAFTGRIRTPTLVKALRAVAPDRSMPD